MVLRAVREHVGGTAEIVGDAVDELDQVIRPPIEDGVAGGEVGIELAQAVERRAIIARRRCLRTERIKAEVPAVLVELQVAARLLQIVIDP